MLILLLCALKGAEPVGRAAGRGAGWDMGSCWGEQPYSGECPCLYHTRGEMISDWLSRWHVLQEFGLLWQSRAQFPNEESSWMGEACQVQREFLALPGSIYQQPIGDRCAGYVTNHFSCRLILTSVSFFLCKYELLAT